MTTEEMANLVMDTSEELLVYLRFRWRDEREFEPWVRLRAGYA